MNKKIASIAISCAMLLSSISAYAEGIDADVSTDGTKIEITVPITAEDYGKNMNIIVLNPGKTLDDMGNADVLQYQSNITVPNEGTELKHNFTVHVKENVSDFGEFTVYAKISGTTIKDDKVFFASSEKREGIVQDLKGITEKTDATDAKKIISDAGRILGFDDIYNDAEIYDKVNKDELLKALINSNAAEAEPNAKKMKELICLVAFNSGLKDSLFSNNELLAEWEAVLEFADIDDEKTDIDIYENTYKKILNSTGKGELADSLMNKDYADVTALKKAFAENAMMYAIRNTDLGGVGHISEILTADNLKYVGLDSNENVKKYLELDDTEKALVNEALKLASSTEKLSDISSVMEEAIADLPQQPTYKPDYGRGESNAPSMPSVTKPQIQPVEIFSDIASVQWAKEAIEQLYRKGIVNGVGENAFAPQANITREQFVVILLKALGIEAEAGTSQFADVVSGSYYEGYVNAAVRHGITNGINDNEFGVGKNITRQDFVTMIVRALDKAGKDIQGAGEKIEFTDKADIAEYAVGAVEKLTAAGVVNGFDDGTFRPSGKCTRAQAAKVIYEIIKGGEF